MEKWQNPETLILWIAIVLILILVLVGTLVSVFYITFHRNIKNKQAEYQRQLDNERQLFEKGLAVQEAERARIGAELHDNIISKLTIIRLKSTINYDFQEIDALLGSTIDETRRISHELSPPHYEEKKFENHIQDIFYRWQKQYQIYSFYNIDESSDFPDDSNFKFHIIRILQELMQNVHKHSEATQLVFILRITPKFTSFLFRDNGKGFYIKNNEDGIGLQNIAVRAKSMDAQYKFVSKQNNGTRFILAFKNKKNGKN